MGGDVEASYGKTVSGNGKRLTVRRKGDDVKHYHYSKSNWSKGELRKMRKLLFTGSGPREQTQLLKRFHEMRDLDAEERQILRRQFGWKRS